MRSSLCWLCCTVLCSALRPPPLQCTAVAAIVATRTDVELRELFMRLDHFDISFFKNSRAVELVHHFINKGSLQVRVGAMCRRPHAHACVHLAEQKAGTYMPACLPWAAPNAYAI